MARPPITAGVMLAVGAAIAFGVTTPLIARFGSDAGPLGTAALLYAGAAALSLATRRVARSSGRALTRAALPKLLRIAFFGAVLAPTLLVWGLSRAGATASSLVLNFEAIFTVVLARIVFREHVGRRSALAAFVMLVGGFLVGIDRAHGFERTQLVGLLAVLGATASWAYDNTVTRGLAEENPVDVVAAKGTLGALATAGLAVALGEPMPSFAHALALLACGAMGYGSSLRLYLLAQRRVGAVRTGSVFALGPFLGAALGWLLDRQGGALTGFAAVAFALGVALHLTERHSHAHVHAPLEHEHAHRHDDGHHDHVHDPPFDGEHSHPHHHKERTHAHPHAPDTHHQHRH